MEDVKTPSGRIIKWFTGIKRLPIASDLCESSLQDAIIECCAPLPTYTLFVHPSQEVPSRALVRGIAADSKDNPFAPQIIVETNDALDRYAWFLRTPSGSVGSEGC